MADEISRYCLSSTNDNAKQQRKVLKNINSRYKNGLELFGGFIELNSKISSISYNKYYALFDNINDHAKLDTLISLHARGCQVAKEVRTMVASGYADGAHARWRTLHEICITFLFLYQEDYKTIQMYNSFQVMDKYKKAKEYMKGCERLGFEPLEKQELDELEGQRNELISLYGKEYAEGYGWTMDYLPKGQRHTRGIEEFVELDHLRMVYAWASENVHFGASANNEKLSLRDIEQHFLLTGPNDCGFLDPVQFTTHSLVEMSSTLLSMEDSLMNGILDELLVFFQKETITEFDKLENEEN